VYLPEWVRPINKIYTVIATTQKFYETPSQGRLKAKDYDDVTQGILAIAIAISIAYPSSTMKSHQCGILDEASRGEWPIVKPRRTNTSVNTGLRTISPILISLKSQTAYMCTESDPYRKQFIESHWVLVRTLHVKPRYLPSPSTWLPPEPNP